MKLHSFQALQLLFSTMPAICRLLFPLYIYTSFINPLHCILYIYILWFIPLVLYRIWLNWILFYEIVPRCMYFSMSYIPPFNPLKNVHFEESPNQAPSMSISYIDRTLSHPISYHFLLLLIITPRCAIDEKAKGSAPFKGFGFLFRAFAYHFIPETLFSLPDLAKHIQVGRDGMCFGSFLPPFWISHLASHAILFPTPSP